MTNKNASPSLIAPLGGVVVGIAVFLGVNFTTGRAIIPTAESVMTGFSPLSKPVIPALNDAVAAVPTGAYQTVCITCHQAEGQGLAGSFPPLAGSEWLNADPGVPIRVVLLGLTGPIEVKGSKFNAVMPPPPGMSDAKIAEAITYARTHFGNHSSEVTTAMVEAVHKAVQGRTTNMTADELRTLMNGASGAGAAGAGVAPGNAPAAPPQAAVPPTKAP